MFCPPPPLSCGPSMFFCKVLCRDSGDWKDMATAILSEIILVDQPQGTELEYRVIALNKASEGRESRAVEFIL